MESDGSDANKILYVASESGAGGTTLVRSLAYEAAAEGFPALVARDSFFRPEPTEVEGFLYRVTVK